MTEKKEKFMTYSLESDLSGICPVCAYMDAGKVVAYHHPDDREIQLPKDCEHFFDSEDEAKEYIRTRIDELRKKIEEFQKIFWEIYGYEKSYSCDHAVTLSDLCIPGNEEKEKEFKEKIKKLARCARTRMIDISGVTVPIGSIEFVDWGSRTEKPVVVLHGGTRVKVDDYEEKKLLELIFEHKG